MLLPLFVSTIVNCRGVVGNVAVFVCWHRCNKVQQSHRQDEEELTAKKYCEQRCHVIFIVAVDVVVIVAMMMQLSLLVSAC